jgi:hypothetical protein
MCECVYRGGRRECGGIGSSGRMIFILGSRSRVEGMHVGEGL